MNMSFDSVDGTWLIQSIASYEKVISSEIFPPKLPTGPLLTPEHRHKRSVLVEEEQRHPPSHLVHGVTEDFPSALRPAASSGAMCHTEPASKAKTPPLAMCTARLFASDNLAAAHRLNGRALCLRLSFPSSLCWALSARPSMVAGPAEGITA